MIDRITIEDKIYEVVQMDLHSSELKTSTTRFTIPNSLIRILTGNKRAVSVPYVDDIILHGKYDCRVINAYGEETSLIKVNEDKFILFFKNNSIELESKLIEELSIRLSKDVPIITATKVRLKENNNITVIMNDVEDIILEMADVIAPYLLDNLFKLIKTEAPYSIGKGINSRGNYLVETTSNGLLIKPFDLEATSSTVIIPNDVITSREMVTTLNKYFIDLKDKSKALLSNSKHAYEVLNVRGSNVLQML